MENQNKNEGNERQFAAMSYVWIFSIFILLGKRDSEFIQHHARRGTILFLVSLILGAFPILWYGEILVLLLDVLGFLAAATGNENNLPLLSEISDGTISARHFRNYWLSLERIFKPGAAPVIKNDEDKNDRVRNLKAKVEEKVAEVEERKISSLYNRVNEDERKLGKLENEVHQLEKKISG